MCCILGFLFQLMSAKGKWDLNESGFYGFFEVYVAFTGLFELKNTEN